MTTSQSSARLTGRRLVLLRVVWAAAAVTFTALTLATLPQDLRRAAQDGDGYIGVLMGLYYLVLALFIFWRRSDDWVASLLSMSFMMALTGENLEQILGSGPVIERVALVLNAISSTLLLCLFYVFPDGRFVPRWTRWAAAIQVAIQFLRIFFEAVYMERGIALVGLMFLTAPVAQTYRYFRASDAVQRQQTKLVVFGLAVTVIPLGVALVAITLTGADFFETNTFGARLGYFIWMAFLVIFPLSITFSILRYRLWDIDIIIRKTLQYTVLSALLALMYFGTVVLLQGIFGRITGVENSPAVIVISTLLIAALFGSLRRKVQQVIDRRFFRQKYNAEQVLARFGRTARDETDLDALTAELVAVVEETMRPESTSVWLKPAGPIKEQT